MFIKANIILLHSLSLLIQCHKNFLTFRLELIIFFLMLTKLFFIYNKNYKQKKKIIYNDVLKMFL